MAKIAFVARSPVSDRTLARHRRHARRLGLPEIGQSGPKRVPLAVVGGGHSAADAVDDLKGWQGDVWAVNGMWRWCRERGINATFYAIDPLPAVVKLAAGAECAVLADTVHPGVFRAVGSAVLARTGKDAIMHAMTAMATVPMIAAEAGYSSVTLFGCDGSFAADGHTHAYKDVPGSRLWVRCGGREFVTSPDLLMQTEFLADLARGLAPWLTVRGDGFLPALIEAGDYDVTHVTRNLLEDLEAA